MFDYRIENQYFFLLQYVTQKRIHGFAQTVEKYTVGGE